MKKVIFLILLVLLLGRHLFSQVRVSGYYRSNGTYVAPHYRSSPDGDPYNNWSYPGNTNPYTGKVATGDPATYLNNYYNRSNTGTSSTYQYSSPSPANHSSSGTTVLYKTHFIDLPFSPPLRSGPGTEYEEIYKCPLGSQIYVLEQDEVYSKVMIDGYTGFISRQLLRSDKTAAPGKSHSPVKSYNIPSGNSALYQTYVIGDLPFNAPLRNGPGIQYREIYQCPPNTIVDVISLGDAFYKVKVNGHVGYISRNLLR